MGKRTLIKHAKAVVTCNATDDVLWNVDLLVEGPKIIAIGKDIKETYDEVIDATGKFI